MYEGAASQRTMRLRAYIILFITPLWCSFNLDDLIGLNLLVIIGRTIANSFGLLSVCATRFGIVTNL